METNILKKTSVEEKSNSTKTQIGLFGFGCVGQGLYDVINESQNLKANIRTICVKDRNKKRKIDSKYFTYDKSDIFSQNDLNVIVELIDSADDALDLVTTALQNGKSVVSANKKLIAENFKELYRIQKQNNVGLLYEGACAGSIPIIRTLEEYYDNELLSKVNGILNGSTNYILTKMELESKDYKEVLAEAQLIGFAEADPWLDVAGYDAKYKTCLLSIHGFGIHLEPNKVLNLGIQNVSDKDIQYAKEKELRIKLIANVIKDGDQLRAYVLPKFIDPTSALYNINYEYNAVEVEGAFSDVQTLVGKGAGSHPTGSAVLSDVSATTYDYKYSYKKLQKTIDSNIDYLNNDFDIRVYIRFEDKEELKKLDIIDVEETFSSSKLNYIIAKVNFKSLFNIFGDKESKLFIAEI